VAVDVVFVQDVEWRRLIFVSDISVSPVTAEMFLCVFVLLQSFSFKGKTQEVKLCRFLRL